jgi:PAS domain S-box-containing protein
VWSASANGAVDFVNERLVKFLGVPPDEIVGWNWERTIHPDDRAGFVAAWRAALTAGEPMEGEIRLRRADGTYTWFLVRNVPLREEGGEVVRWFGSAVEIEDRKRIEQERKRYETEITALNERLMRAQEEERSRIAGELHDGVAQQITTVNILVGIARRQVPLDPRTAAALDDAEEKLIQMGTDVRHLSHQLHPALLKEAGLPDALSSYCREFSKTRGLPVRCEADAGAKDLSPGAALALYRIAQEALGNTAKHAKAKQVRVQLEKMDGVVRLIVSDDGVGFVFDRSGKPRGVGLVNMRERLRYLNGTFEIDSEPGRGTTIRAAVPFRPA